MHSQAFVQCALSALTLSLSAIAGSVVLRDDGAATQPSVGSAQDMFLKHLLAESADYDYDEFYNSSSKAGEDITVGIVGAGAAGLYAAILLESLGIDYEILESSDRVGGRVFTYRFDQEAWDASEPGEPAYYDYYVCFQRLLSFSRARLTMGIGCWTNEIPWHGPHESDHWDS